MSQYRYFLDPSSKKHKCPQCGKPTFVVYIDQETGQPVDPYQFGRCDREAKCGYHSHPKEDPAHQAAAQESFVPRPDPEVVQIYPGEEKWGPIINRTKTCVSPFHLFCNKKLLIPNDHLLRWGVYSDQDDLTVFVYRNREGKVANLKWFKFKEDGHRDQGFNSYSLKQPRTSPYPTNNEKSKIGGRERQRVEKYQMSLFGEHLLPAETDGKIVCLVESEKTAVLASFFYPQYHWVACGSASGLSDGSNGTPNKVAQLNGFEVYWVCDADSAGRKGKNNTGQVTPSSLRHLLQHIEKVAIVDLLPDKTDGSDIGDMIIAGLRPEIVPTWKKGQEEKIEERSKEDDLAYLYKLPKGVEWDKVKWDIFKYNHFEHEGKIWIVRKRKSASETEGAYFCEDITNFTIKSLGLIDSKTEPRRLVEIHNIHKFTKVLQVPTKAFASPTEFTVFIESEGNYQYDGIGTDLKKIRSRLYDTMPAFEEVESLGWHPAGYFLFANGAYNGKFQPIDKYGFVKLEGKSFYIEPLSCITREGSEDWEDEKKFTFKKRDDVTLKQWADLFVRVHKDNGRIALAWYITSLFRDFVYQRFKFFPHLFLFGPPGTGKSQVGWSIRAMGFCGLVKPFNLNTGTAVAFHREFQHFKNFPAWCDEYDNTIAYERIQALKAAYDGVGHKKSVKDSDKRTKSTQVNRSILISGQQLPIADNALFKRCILLQFHQTEFSDQEKKLFADLQDMEGPGLSFITAGFMHFRKTIEELYVKEFDTVLDDMVNGAKEMGFDVEDRILRNACIILTTIKLIQPKLQDKFPYNYKELRDLLLRNVKEQMSLISNANETNTFWEMVEFLVREQRIKEGEDFVFDERKMLKVIINKEQISRELEKTTSIVYVRFSKIIPLYKEAFKRQNASTASPMDRSSLMHYLQHSKPFIGLVAQVTFKDCRTSAYAFDYGILQAMGVNLGGGENNSGTPPPMGTPPGVPPGTNQPDLGFSAEPGKGGTDDIPF